MTQRSSSTSPAAYEKAWNDLRAKITSQAEKHKAIEDNMDGLEGNVATSRSALALQSEKAKKIDRRIQRLNQYTEDLLDFVKSYK